MNPVIGKTTKRAGQILAKNREKRDHPHEMRIIRTNGMLHCTENSACALKAKGRTHLLEIRAADRHLLERNIGIKIAHAIIFFALKA